LRLKAKLLASLELMEHQATLGIATAVAAAAPVAAAALKNLRLEGVLAPFNDFLFLIIMFSPLVN
jgi:hypothetical protein